MNKQDYIDEIRKRLSERRFEHSMNVARAAVELAEKYGADPRKAEIAGILHDITKEMPPEEQLQMLDGFGIILDNVERHAHKLLHAISGAAVAKRMLDVSDQEILSAVRYHTTARAGMTRLEKVLYIADFISDDRDYDGIELMRSFAWKSLDLAMYEGLAFTIRDLVRQGNPVHADTVNAYNEIVLSGAAGKNPPVLA